MSDPILKLPLSARPATFEPFGVLQDGDGANLLANGLKLGYAKEIVRRVNAFDDLLAACEKGQRVISEIADITTENRAGWALKDLEAAIAKAKEAV